MAHQAETDGGAIVHLIMAHLDEAHRVANWILRDAAAAEDAVQEAAILAWDRRASLRDPAAADAWFGRIVVNVCREELRRRGRRPSVTDLSAASMAARAPAMRGDLGVRDEVSRALGRLTPDEQVLLTLRFGRDLTVPEIAARLAVPDGTVKSRLHAALEHARAALAAERRADEESA